MILSHILAMFMKDLKTSIKNRTILIIILIPIIMSLIFNIIYSSASNSIFPIAIHDEGNNSNFIEYLKSIKIYDITIVDSDEQAKNRVLNGNAIAAMVIPEEFADDVKSGAKPSLSILVDTNNMKSLTFLQSYKEVIYGYLRLDNPINITLKTAGLTNSLSSIPTWLVFSIIFVGITILPNILTAEKEKKTLDAILISPMSEKEVIVGKTLFGLLLTLIVTFLILLLNNAFTGNVPLMLLLILLGSIVFIGIGLLIASITDNYSTATVLSTLIMTPMFLLTYLGNAIKGMDVIMHLIPSTYLLNGINEAISNNEQNIFTQILALMGFIVIIYVLIILAINKKKSMS